MHTSLKKKWGLVSKHVGLCIQQDNDYKPASKWICSAGGGEEMRGSDPGSVTAWSSIPSPLCQPTLCEKEVCAKKYTSSLFKLPIL